MDTNRGGQDEERDAELAGEEKEMAGKTNSAGLKYQGRETDQAAAEVTNGD